MPSLDQLIVWIVVGLLGGSLAGLLITRDREGFGLLRNLGVGLAVAAAMVLLAIGGALPFGRVHIEWNGSASGLPAIGATVLVLSLAAFNEELVFRGYPFQVFLRGIGVWPAMLLISFIWAMLHSRNDGATVLSTLNTMIAGVFLSWAYMRTRSIWL